MSVLFIPYIRADPTLNDPMVYYLSFVAKFRDKAKKEFSDRWTSNALSPGGSGDSLSYLFTFGSWIGIFKSVTLPPSNFINIVIVIHSKLNQLQEQLEFKKLKSLYNEGFG